MTVRGLANGEVRRTARHWPLVWPKDEKGGDLPRDTGFVGLIERRPELGDMFLPTVAEVFKENV